MELHHCHSIGRELSRRLSQGFSLHINIPIFFLVSFILSLFTLLPFAPHPSQWIFFLFSDKSKVSCPLGGKTLSLYFTDEGTPQAGYFRVRPYNFVGMPLLLKADNIFPRPK
jgi:hypothetical protein